MDINTIQEKLSKFASDRDWEQFHSPKNLAMALSVEVSELVEIFQWLTPEQSSNLNNKQMAATQEEVADIAIYLLRLCDVLGINLTNVVEDKIKLNTEKYPVEVSKGNAGGASALWALCRASQLPPPQLFWLLSGPS